MGREIDIRQDIRGVAAFSKEKIVNRLLAPAFESMCTFWNAE
jgi:hypothetical protein